MKEETTQQKNKGSNLQPSPAMNQDDPCEWNGRILSKFHEFVDFPGGHRCIKCKKEYQGTIAERPKPEDETTLPAMDKVLCVCGHSRKAHYAGRLSCAHGDTYWCRCEKFVSRRDANVEMLPLDEQAQARIKIEGKTWEITAHCRERQLLTALRELRTMTAAHTKEVMLHAVTKFERGALKAERDALRTSLIAAGRNAGCFLADTVSSEFLAGVADEVKAIRSQFDAVVGQETALEAMGKLLTDQRQNTFHAAHTLERGYKYSDGIYVHTCFFCMDIDKLPPYTPPLKAGQE
jgi:hypothetical protein